MSHAAGIYKVNELNSLFPRTSLLVSSDPSCWKIFIQIHRISNKQFKQHLPYVHDKQNTEFEKPLNIKFHPETLNTLVQMDD